LPFAGELFGDLSAVPTLTIIGVIYLGLVPTAIAFSTWAYALKYSTAGRLGVTTFAVPPITILLGGSFSVRCRRYSRSWVVHSRWWASL
jgi:drug/metabolite transporter (DMT)-like permease